MYTELKDEGIEDVVNSAREAWNELSMVMGDNSIFPVEKASVFEEFYDLLIARLFEPEEDA